MEEYAKGKAGEAIRKLIDLQPQTATLLKDGREITGMINHMDDARKNGIHADDCRLNGYYSGTIDTATDDFMPYFFNDRNVF
jgi:hypothetical protein